MNFFAATFFLWLTLFITCQAFGKRRYTHFELESVAGDVELVFNQQKLDHFTPEDERVFSQQYFENLANFNSSNGPIILLVCGEWDCDGTYGAFVPELAKLLGAAVVTLEHRYYGQSSPFEDLTMENLKYLTAEQALYDLALFRQYYQNLTNEKLKKQGDNPWFVIGLSYPGALSAWFRLKFPHLVHGSLASSGVVEAVLCYSAYDEQVGISTGPECASALREITRLAEQGLEANATAIKTLFNATDLLDEDFLSFLADVPAGYVQSARQGLLCIPLLQARREQKDLLKYFANFTSSYDTRDWNREVAKNSTKVGDSVDRAWSYQSCTQFGFFQVASSNNSIRSSRINLKYYLDLCSYVFGTDIYPKVDQTNLNYGGSNISGSNIFFINGSQDPWKHASKLTSSRGEPSFVLNCDTCSHGAGLVSCQREGNITEQCSSQLEKAHSLITKHAKRWLMV